MEKKRQIAERLFVENGYTAKAIAETIGVTEKTVGNWNKKFGWEEKKLLNISAPHEIKQLLSKEIKNILDTGEASFNADALSKVMKALAQVDKNVNTQMVISVFKEFDNWLITQDIDSKFLDDTLKKHKEFIQHKIENE